MFYYFPESPATIPTLKFNVIGNAKNNFNNGRPAVSENKQLDFLLTMQKNLHKAPINGTICVSFFFCFKISENLYTIQS